MSLTVKMSFASETSGQASSRVAPRLMNHSAALRQILATSVSTGTAPFRSADQASFWGGAKRSGLDSHRVRDLRSCKRPWVPAKEILE